MRNKVFEGVPEVVKGDPLRLRQVLQNLLGNAVKFTEFGTVDVNVKLTKQTEGRVEILTEVTDTGVGMFPLTLPEIPLPQMIAPFVARCPLFT